MTWTKTSDDFPDDCETLSDAAYRLHHEGLTWSNRKLLDLCLPKDRMVKWATRPEAAAELVACGFWTDEGNHYLIRHHGAYQRTREETIAIQERNQRNGKSGGRPRKTPREVWDGAPETQMGSQTATEMETEGVRTGQGRALEEGAEVGSFKACVHCGSTSGSCPCFDTDRTEPEGWR